jgi:hypothetical protein
MRTQSTRGPSKRRTPRARRGKKRPTLTNKRYWIHPNFAVGVYVEDPHALPARIQIMRHDDEALSVATSSDSICVTAVDSGDRDCAPEIYDISVRIDNTVYQTNMGNQSFGQILPSQIRSVRSILMNVNIRLHKWAESEFGQPADKAEFQLLK